MRRLLTALAALAFLAFAAPAFAACGSGSDPCGRSDLEGWTNATVFPNHVNAVTPEALNPLLRAFVDNHCNLTSAADCLLPAGVAATNLGLNAKGRADLAYQSFIARFWTGTQTSGHLAVINGNTISGPAANPPVETTVQKGWLWQDAVGWTVIYDYWRVTGGVPAASGVSPSGGNPDAFARIAAVGTWVKSTWSASDLSVCNNVGGQAATTLDDANWAVRGLVDLYYATGDTTFLTYGKNLIDCMNGSNGFYDYALSGSLGTHWYDATPGTASWSGGVLTVTLSRSAAVATTAGQYFNIASSSNANINGTWQAASVSGNVITVTMASSPGGISGGLWYHSGQGKGMDSLNYALAELAYYTAACPLDGSTCPSKTGYFTAAKNEIDWANGTLDRAANTNCPQSDHTYWSGVGYGSPPLPMDANGTFCTRANNIGLAGSDVGLAENMGGAAANAWLYALTSTASYATQAQNVASAILAKEIDTCGGFLDDRDARIGGFASYDFATRAMPVLFGSASGALKSAFLATSLGVAQANRSAFGTFSGDWCGPWQGVWTGKGFNPDQIEISAQAAIFAIVAAGL